MVIVRLLRLHSDFIEYELIGKEVDGAEDASPGKIRFEDLVVVFTAIEKDDDELVVQEAAEDTANALKKLKCIRALFYPYAHLSSNLESPQRALSLMQKLAEVAKNKGIEVFRAPFGWTKSFNIKIKGHPLAEQSRTFVSGEAQPVTQQVVSKAVAAEEKLRSEFFVIGRDGTLIPYEKFDFSSHERLKKLAQYEIQKSRAVHQVPPHVDLMKKLELVDYEPASDPGNLRFYPKGRLMKSLLEQYVTSRVREYGGMEVETPIMYDYKHPSLASYLDRFPARQYTVKSEEKDLFLRFSACFGQFLMAKDLRLIRKHLPFRIYELTRYSFRREKSGELVGLRRLRAFTMPDTHALCADIAQAKEEAKIRFRLCKSVLEGIGLMPEDYELAIRFTKEFYAENEDFINELVAMQGKPAFVEIWNGRFFYFTFKWEFNFVDNLGKAAALSTDQIDIENAERYGMAFVDEKGAKVYPLVLHCSPSGAIERCMYALLEKCHFDISKGKAPILPLWLSPTQVRLIPVSEKYYDFVETIADKIEVKKIRVDIDDREEKVSKKIRDAEVEWINYIVVLGEQEAQKSTIKVRDRSHGTIRETTLEGLIEEILTVTQGKPWLPLPLSRKLSVRPRFSG